MIDYVAERGVLPHNLEAERSVIGAIILDNQSLYQVMEFLHPDDFYSEAHRTLYRVCRDLINDSQPVDLVILRHRLLQTDELDAIGGISYVAAMVDVPQTTANTEHYGRIVKESARLRAMIRVGHDMIEKCYRGDEDADTILDCASTALAAVAETRASQLMSAPEFTQAQRDYFDTLQGTSNHVTGIETGLLDLDRMTDGLQKGEMAIIAARPSQGKTSLATSIIVNTPHVRTCFFSIEQKNIQIVNRMISKIGNVDGFDLRRGRLDSSTWRKVEAVNAGIGERKLWLHQGSASLNQIRATAKKLKTQHGLDLLVVDYLGLVRHTLPRNQQHKRHDIVAEISHALKNLATDLNISVVVLQQLNRETNGRQRPELHHLRESGDTEQDADLVLFLWTMLVKPKDGKAYEQNVITIAKQRNGSIGDVRVTFRRQYTDFQNAEEQRTHE